MEWQSFDSGAAGRNRSRLDLEHSIKFALHNAQAKYEMFTCWLRLRYEVLLLFPDYYLYCSQVFAPSNLLDFLKHI